MIKWYLFDGGCVKMSQSNNPLEMKTYLIDDSLKLFGQKFALDVIQNMLFLKQKRFSEFLHSIDGINTKTLSIRLKDLEGYGLVERKILKNRPLEVEYNLTEKGMALESILTEMIEFSKVFKSKNTFEDGKQDEIFLGSKTRLSSVYDY